MPIAPYITNTPVVAKTACCTIWQYSFGILRISAENRTSSDQNIDEVYQAIMCTGNNADDRLFKLP